MNPQNPKDVVGSTKLPLYLVPITMVAGMALALFDGMLKYGRTNWRKTPITLSEYIAAAKRHLDACMECEVCDPDSGIDHLYHAQATIGIIIDARVHGTLIDDRNFVGEWSRYRELIGDLTPHVKRLREKHAGKNPRHYTAADNA